MSSITTPSDKKETWAGYVRKSALKIYLKLLILRKGEIRCRVVVKRRRRNTVGTTETFCLNFEETGRRIRQITSNRKSLAIRMHEYTAYRALLSVCITQRPFAHDAYCIRRCLTGQPESLHSQVQFSEVELCGTKPGVHGSPPIVTMAHLNISRNVTANYA
jgi:hypothetical protein